MDESPVKDFLLTFYSQRGSIDMTSLSGAIYELVKCASCGLVYQRHVLDDILASKLYDEWIDPATMQHHHESAFGLDTYIDYAEGIMTMLRTLDGKPSDIRVLDFAMGWCKWARMARAFGCRTTGCELARSRIDYARSQGLEVIAYEDIPSHKFDIINAEQVFEHLREPFETLQHLGSALSPHGIMSIGVPGGDLVSRNAVELLSRNRPDIFMKELMPAQPLEHINCFGTECLLAMAHRCALEPVTLPLKVRMGYRTTRTVIGGGLQSLLSRIKGQRSAGLHVLLAHRGRNAMETQ